MNHQKTSATTAPLRRDSLARRVILRSPLAHRFQSKRFQSRRKPLAHWIRHSVSICLALSFFLCCRAGLRAAPPETLPAETLAGLQFRQNLNTLLPLEENFQDQSGRVVRFRDCLRGRPAILVLGYYECPMLCNAVLNGLLNGLNDLKRTAGKDYDLIFVSIDPRETPSLAAAKRASYLRRYDRPGAEAGWHFLTGQKPAIDRLAAAAGFSYAYEPATRQYAHPAGVLVLTPDGKVSQYLFGMTFSPAQLNDALMAASKRQIGNPIQNLLMLCFHYNPITGKYGSLIMALVRLSGVLTVVALGFVLLRSARIKRDPAASQAPEPFTRRKHQLPAP